MDSVAMIPNAGASMINQGIAKTRVAAEKMGQMVATSFVNTMLESLKIDPKLKAYNMFLSEGIVDGMSRVENGRGLVSDFADAIERQFTGNRLSEAFVANTDVVKNEWANMELPPRRKTHDGAHQYEMMEAAYAA